jgi:hypothetical protein
MPTNRYPTLNEIQDATTRAIEEARNAAPRTWPLYADTVVDGNVTGPLHTVQERMTSGTVSDAPDDGGPLALGKGSNEPPSTVRR